MRPALLALILLFCVHAEARAMIDPAFLGLGRIGFLCRVEPHDQAAQALAQEVCRRAAALASRRLPAGLPALALAEFDPLITDPGTLLVTLHGNRLDDRLALAIGLHRQGNPPGSLFPAPPQMVEWPAGGGVDGAALDRALAALLEHPVLAPLTPSPGRAGPLR